MGPDLVSNPRLRSQSGPHLLVATLFLGLVFGLPLPGQSVQYAQSALTWTEAERDYFLTLPEVSVGTDSTWPPMEYINRQGELVGFDIDLLREIGLRAGFRPVFTTVPWDGIFAGLMAGQYDMIASSVTLLDERTRVMRFSEPYLQAAQYLVVPAARTDVRTLRDLAGGDVGAQIGTTGSRLVEATPGVTLRAYDDLGLAVEDLDRGRLAGIVADTAIVQYYILSHPRYRGNLRVADQPYTVEEYAFAIRMDLPELQAGVNKGLEMVKQDGTLKKLEAFWFPDLGPDHFDTPGEADASDGHSDG
ncbi:MAG: basic amino acid ABC transporter substrate-binding protein [Alkalispirochaeta sp.]|jgi:polar amino acid transport system substrate-binding protein